MRHRLGVLNKHDLKLSDIQAVINDMGPLEGAGDFLDWLRQRYQVVILSDTFYEFGMPLMAHLGYPTLLCHKLAIRDDHIVDYRLRQNDQKREAVKSFHALNFKVIAAGDSYNDTSMLGEADAGILFCPPQNVIDEFPQFPVTTNYTELREAFIHADKSI
jgi:phosphoserine/homoserine phosphotransferase